MPLGNVWAFELLIPFIKKNVKHSQIEIIKNATEAVTGGAFVKKVFLEISQNSQKKFNFAKICFLIKLQA